MPGEARRLDKLLEASGELLELMRNPDVALLLLLQGLDPRHEVAERALRVLLAISDVHDLGTYRAVIDTSTFPRMWNVGASLSTSRRRRRHLRGVLRHG